MGKAMTTSTKKWAQLFTVSFGIFLTTLSGGIVTISLPNIADYFGVGIPVAEWIVAGYLLASGALLLAFGRLGDIVGYRWVFVAGLAIFVVAGTACGLAQGAEQLVALRVFQGLGNGMVLAVGPAIVTRAFDPTERGKALGLLGISVALALAVGPLSGGALTQWVSWRWIFLINLPLGIFGLFYALRTLPGERGFSGATFDYLGAALSCVSLVALIVALLEGQSWGWPSTETVGLFAVFVVLGIGFLLAEVRVRRPIVEVELFSIRSFSAGNVGLLVAFVAFAGAIFLLPFYLQREQGLSAITAGLVLTPLPVATLVLSPIGGLISDRVGPKLPAAAGMAVLVAGAFSFTSVDMQTGYLGLAWRFVLLGAGLGLFTAPNQSAILGSVAKSRLGIASGVVSETRLLGQVLGTAMAGLIIATLTPLHARQLAAQGIPGHLIEGQSFILSVHDTFYVFAAVCVVGVLASLLSSGEVQADRESSQKEE